MLDVRANEITFHFPEGFVKNREVSFHLRKDFGRLPNKDARVPVVVPIGKVRSCGLEIRFLNEARYLKESLLFGTRGSVDLDIPVSCFRMVRLDPKGNETVRLRPTDSSPSRRNSFASGIAWSDGITIIMDSGEARERHMAAKPIAGAVFLPTGSLMNRIFLANAPRGLEMEPNILGLVFRRYNPNVFRRNNTLNSLDGLPQKRVFPKIWSICLGQVSRLRGRGADTSHPRESPHGHLGNSQSLSYQSFSQYIRRPLISYLLVTQLFNDLMTLLQASAV